MTQRMNAAILITMQIASLMLMLFTADDLFGKDITIALFATSFIILAHSSVYIGKNCNRLLKELNRNEKH